MGTWFRSWRQTFRTHPVGIVLIALLLVVIVISILIILGYIFNWSWTGLGSYISPPHTTGSDFHRGKTLWDWLQLFIIPLALAVAALLFNLATSRTEQRIALDKQRQDSLQTYLDRISELQLGKQPRTSEPDTQVRNVARALTLTVLPQLDAQRKGNLIQILYESKLLEIISLGAAKITEEQLKTAKSLKGTTMPDGSIYE